MVQSELVNLSDKELEMNKNIIIEVNEDGMIESVYCPDHTFTVDLLDRSDSNLTEEVARYYEALEEETEDMINCF